MDAGLRCGLIAVVFLWFLGDHGFLTPVCRACFIKRHHHGLFHLPSLPWTAVNYDRYSILFFVQTYSRMSFHGRGWVAAERQVIMRFAIACSGVAEPRTAYDAAQFLLTPLRIPCFLTLLFHACPALPCCGAFPCAVHLHASSAHPSALLPAMPQPGPLPATTPAPSSSLCHTTFSHLPCSGRRAHLFAVCCLSPAILHRLPRACLLAHLYALRRCLQDLCRRLHSAAYCGALS